MNNRRKSLGTYGERLVEKQYIKRGYRLLDRNYRCRFGEIDLIFQKEDKLYFVEVRTKSSLARHCRRIGQLAKKRDHTEGEPGLHVGEKDPHDPCSIRFCCRLHR